MTQRKMASAELPNAFALMVGATLRFWATVIRAIAEKVRK
jgi:hypothetical protein